MLQEKTTMKYFTKEFYVWERLSRISFTLKKSKRAEQKDENFYQRVYNKKYAAFTDLEKTSDWYRDPNEELKKLDDYINEPEISDAERAVRRKIRDFHVILNAKRIESGIYFEYDEESAKRRFDERIRAKIELCRQLPKEILDKVADIRMLALEYASEEVKQLLTPYCAKLRRTVQRIREKACAETNKAESYLSNVFGLNGYEDYLLTGLEEKDGDIYIKGERLDELIIKQGEIIEGKGQTIYAYNADRPNSPWSRVIATELHRTADKFELHFLISNSDEFDREELWDLTIRGVDVL